MNEFWTRANQALQEAQRQTAKEANSRVVYSVDQFLIYARNGIAEPMFQLDDTGIRLGNVLVINTPGRKVYIGAGNYANDDTPFYIDTLGRFSLGANLTWDPDTSTLTITGTINATSGTIGGFTIGPDYIRDTANSFGLASTVTAGDDVRFWAGDTFANRESAPLRILENGVVLVHTLEVVDTSVLFTEQDAGIYVQRSIFATAATNIAKGILNQPQLFAGANGDSLRTSFAQATYTPSGFTVADATGLWIEVNSIVGGGSITNAYGIYVGTVSVATNNYGVYVDTTALNYFGGDTGIGVAPSTTTRLILAAGTTGVSSLRMPHGVAPTAVVDGDLWTTTAGLFVQINGVTVGPLS